jgi:hypothetical protein
VSAPTLSADQLRALADMLERGEPRPLAKTKASSVREIHNSKAHAGFVAAIDVLLKAKVSKRQIAFQMDMDVHTLCDVLAGNRKLQGWMIAALPRDARREFLRIAGLWDDEQLDGTNG